MVESEAQQGDAADRLVHSLQTLDLDEKHARAYVTTALLGPLKPADLGQHLTLKRSDAYRVLDELARRGFVRPTLEKPVRFEAWPPEIAFDLELARLHERRARVEAGRADAIRLYEELRGSQPTGPASRVVFHQLLQGRRDCLLQFARMVRDAEETFECITTMPGAPIRRHAERMGIQAEFARRVAEGLRVRSITSFTDARRYQILAQHRNVEIRTSTLTGLGIAIMDRRGVLIWQRIGDPDDSDSPDDAALYTNAEAMVRFAVTSFDALWDDSSALAGVEDAESPRRAVPVEDRDNA